MWFLITFFGSSCNSKRHSKRFVEMLRSFPCLFVNWSRRIGQWLPYRAVSCAKQNDVLPPTNEHDWDRENGAEGTRFEELMRLEMELIDYDLKIIKAVVESHLAIAAIEKYLNNLN